MIDKRLVFVDSNIKNKDELLQFIADAAYQLKRVDNIEECYKAFLAREHVISTGIGSGIAIPHATSEHILRPSLVFVRLKNPIEFQSIDDEPVSLVFAILLPAGDYEFLHLNTLSKIAGLMLDQTAKDIFSNADEKEIYAVLKDIDGFTL